MKIKQLDSGLLVPHKEPNRHNYPNGLPNEDRFKLFTFVVYYEQDVDKLKKIVEKKNGLWEGYMEINGLNIWNKPIGLHFLCAYYFTEPIEMEVLC